MPKFFVNHEQIKGNYIKIVGEDVNHIANVLRLKKGDTIFVGDKNEGITYKTNMLEVKEEYIGCVIFEKIQQEAESRKVEVTIFQGLPKADKMEYIIQKSTELGASCIVPVKMKRCIAKLDGKDEKKKIERWQKIAEVAAKQSGRDMIPNIKNVMTIQELKEKITNFDVILVAYENEKEVSLKSALQKAHSRRLDKDLELSSQMKPGENIEDFKAKINEKLKIGIVIGPEGGLEKEEVEELRKARSKSDYLRKSYFENRDSFSGNIK